MVMHSIAPESDAGDYYYWTAIGARGDKRGTSGSDAALSLCTRVQTLIPIKTLSLVSTGTAFIIVMAHCSLSRKDTSVYNQVTVSIIRGPMPTLGYNIVSGTM